MNIKKPNSFARYGNDYVAPLTTIDQIVKPSGERYTDREFELISNVENVMFGENCAGKNLLNPTLQTTTKNGITCTNNGDGTYTFNGTSTSAFNFVLCNLELSKGTYKFVGSPKNSGNYQIYAVNNTLSENYIGDTGNGYEFSITQPCSLTFYLWGDTGTFNNILFKPMLTTDLTATYNDFEPYVKSLKQLTNSALNMDLLWTNASPTSAFEPQTISLGIDLSQYKYLLFEWHEFVSYYSKFYSEIIGYNKGIVSIATGERRYREYSITTENSISFESAYSNGTTANNYMIPMRIFGVK